MLTWDRPSSDVLSYHVWQSVGSGSFSIIASPTNTSATVTPDATQITRYFITAIYPVPPYSPGESVPSNTVTNTPTVTPPSGQVFEAEAGALTAPFVADPAGFVSQAVLTTSADGGRAAYLFNVSTNGKYVVNAVLNAPDNGADSLYVAIDSDPSETNLWDVPLTQGFELRMATWRGVAENPKLWTLTNGSHTLVLRGREAGLQIDKVSVGLWMTLPATNPPPATNLPPVAPSNLRLSVITAHRFDVSWTGDITAGTKIERAVESDPFWEVATVNAGVLHWTDNFVSRRNSYRYRARSFNSLGFSGYSGELFYTAQ